MKEYRVMMYIDGRQVENSCVKCGPQAEMNNAALRLTRTASPRVTYQAVECIDAPRTLRAYTSRIDGVTRRQEIDGTLTAYIDKEGI